MRISLGHLVKTEQNLDLIYSKLPTFLGFVQKMFWTGLLKPGFVHMDKTCQPWSEQLNLYANNLKHGSIKYLINV